MRQANNTIKGYLYQFNKSILEILNADEDASITLEGVIEDIDIQLSGSITTIQCKYHEDKRYQISSVAAPILEMLCHYHECSIIGKSISYVLYAYFAENAESVSREDFIAYVKGTTNKDIQISYFHRIYEIPDEDILNIANKPKKSKADKEKLYSYYDENRGSLKLCVNLEKFWECFTYCQAEQFDLLRQKILDKLAEYVSVEEAENLYYPNAFSIVANLSAKQNEIERTISKKDFLNIIFEKKTVLITKWMLAAMDTKKVLKNKKEHLLSSFAVNTEIRAFIFSGEFIAKNSNEIVPFIQSYISKYFRKPRLHKPPIFIFDNECEDIMQSVILGLYKYQKTVNTGMVGNTFVSESFINNSDCSPNFVCKITLLKNVDTDLLERCMVNNLYVIGNMPHTLESQNYNVENIDVEGMNILKYLVDIDKVLEV